VAVVGEHDRVAHRRQYSAGRGRLAGQNSESCPAMKSTGRSALAITGGSPACNRRTKARNRLGVSPRVNASSASCGVVTEPPRGLDLDLKVTTDGAAGRENEDRERDILISARVRSLHAGLLGVGLGGDATFVQLSSSPDGLPPERRRRGLARPRPGPPIFSM
jgi:hypothetical protein